MPKPPKPALPAPPPALPPTISDSAIIAAREQQRHKSAKAQTVLTSQSGLLTPASTAGKTLLGS